ncbi:MAG: HdeD family acid-resistance protein [Flavisolibacter sp.]
MKYLLRKTSNMFIVSGLVKIAAGILICLWPIADFTPLIYLFGLPALVQGIVHLTNAVQYRSRYEDWPVLLVQGVIYLVAGATVVGYPGVTPGFLMVAIATAWLLSGIVNILMSVQLNREAQKEVGLLSSGLLSIIGAVYLFTNLDREVYVLLWILVIYSFLIGILTIIFGVKSKTWDLMYFDDYRE